MAGTEAPRKNVERKLPRDILGEVTAHGRNRVFRKQSVPFLNIIINESYCVKVFAIKQIHAMQCKAFDGRIFFSRYVLVLVQKEWLKSTSFGNSRKPVRTLETNYSGISREDNF